jgi:hypothetical protein
LVNVFSLLEYWSPNNGLDLSHPSIDQYHFPTHINFFIQSHLFVYQEFFSPNPFFFSRLSNSSTLPALPTRTQSPKSTFLKSDHFLISRPSLSTKSQNFFRTTTLHGAISTVYFLDRRPLRSGNHHYLWTLSWTSVDLWA